MSNLAINSNQTERKTNSDAYSYGREAHRCGTCQVEQYGRGLLFDKHGWRTCFHVNFPILRAARPSNMAVYSSIQIPNIIQTEKICKISNFAAIASYSWLDKEDPTIMVPGKGISSCIRPGRPLTSAYIGEPPRWSPPPVALLVQPHTNAKYLDEDADRTPGSPLQATIRAVQLMWPKFDFRKLDVIIDRR